MTSEIRGRHLFIAPRASKAGHRPQSFDLTILLLAFFFSTSPLVGCWCVEPSGEVEELGDEVPREPSPTVTYDGRLRLVALRLEQDGVSTPLETNEVLEVPAGASIFMETWQRLDDHRVRLVDQSDRLVPFELESGPVTARPGPSPEPGGSWFRLTPGEELREGHTYMLRIEPELAERITDHEGLQYEDLALEVRRMETTELEAEEPEPEQ